jgi:hypothetical protein
VPVAGFPGKTVYVILTYRYNGNGDVLSKDRCGKGRAVRKPGRPQPLRLQRQPERGGPGSSNLGQIIAVRQLDQVRELESVPVAPHASSEQVVKTIGRGEGPFWRDFFADRCGISDLTSVGVEIERPLGLRLTTLWHLSTSAISSRYPSRS